MMETDEIEQSDIDRMNAAIRIQPMSQNDVRQIAAYLHLGENTVSRWFDSTNGGDYSPCIPEAATGRELYDLDTQPANYGAYEQGPDAYENEDSDEYPDADYGSADPTEQNMGARIMLGMMLSEGLGRETGGDPEKNVTTTYQGDTLVSILEAANQIVNAEQSSFDAKCWTRLKMHYDVIDDVWYLDYTYCEDKELIS